jgi:hypothetical protein
LLIGFNRIDIPIRRLNPPLAIFAEKFIHGFGEILNIHIRALELFAPVMIDDLMFKDAEKPGSFRRLTLEPILGSHGGQKGFLDKIFGNGFVSDPLKGEAKKDITMLIHPDIRV